MPPAPPPPTPGSVPEMGFYGNSSDNPRFKPRQPEAIEPQRANSLTNIGQGYDDDDEDYGTSIDDERSCQTHKCWMFCCILFALLALGAIGVLASVLIGAVDLFNVIDIGLEDDNSTDS